MTDEEFRAWLYAPLPLADLLAIELRESCRQWSVCVMTEVADHLAEPIERERVWRDTAESVWLRDLAEIPQNPWREPRGYARRARRRQRGFCEATATADAPAAETAADRVWDEVRSEVILRDLAWLPENPWRE